MTEVKLPNLRGRGFTIGAIDVVTLEILAEICRIPQDSIEDIYSCTPFQTQMMAANRSEIFHFILTSTRSVEPALFCDALRQVVADNAILRTHVVECEPFGFVNVVSKKNHATNFNTGFDSVEEFLERRPTAAHHRFENGQPGFRSAYVGQSLVATIHHAVMDYWSIDKLIKVDWPTVYAGNPPIQRSPFVDFVSHCQSAEDAWVEAFWASRFHGNPAIFPAARSAQALNPIIVEHPARHVKFVVSDVCNLVDASHIPLYIEAAWAITASIYTDSESVAYGYVLSGRSLSMGGLENTLGPTAAEVPVQVNLRRRTMTVEKLIKDRAGALRQLQQQTVLLHCGLERIKKVSNAARIAASFQTLINIRPSVFADKDLKMTSDDDSISMRMVWLGGYYPLQLIFSISDKGVEVWPRTDAMVIGNDHLDQILNQFEHVFCLLTENSPKTKLGDLSLLDLKAQARIVTWNRTSLEASRSLPREATENFVTPLDSVFKNTTCQSERVHGQTPGALWIADINCIDNLAPWGGIGEVILEIARTNKTQASAASTQINSPKWMLKLGVNDGKTQFYRTGSLARYDTDESLHWIGQKSNRIKLGANVVQLERLESTLKACAVLDDLVVAPKIFSGRTKLVAVFCPVNSERQGRRVLEVLPRHISGVCTDTVYDWARSHLPTEHVPTAYYAVVELPRLSSHEVDRRAVHEWLKRMPNK